MTSATPPRGMSRTEIARRAALDLPAGICVNLGVGMPTLVADYIPPERQVILHSENGLLGFGPTPPPDGRDLDLSNASSQFVTLLPGGAVVNHADSFALIRGGHIDMTLLGAFQVSVTGDLANWSLGEEEASLPPAVGGAMDLAFGARTVWVLMDHTERDGTAKIVERCSYPLTAPGVVKRIYTNLAVIDVTPEGLHLRKTAPGIDAATVQAWTAARLLTA